MLFLVDTAASTLLLQLQKPFQKLIIKTDETLLESAEPGTILSSPLADFNNVDSYPTSTYSIIAIKVNIEHTVIFHEIRPLAALYPPPPPTIHHAF